MTATDEMPKVNPSTNRGAEPCRVTSSTRTKIPSRSETLLNSVNTASELDDHWIDASDHTARPASRPPTATETHGSGSPRRTRNAIARITPHQAAMPIDPRA